MMNGAERSTITLSRRTLNKLKKLKKELKVSSYDELINILIDKSRESIMNELLDLVTLSEEEAEETKRIIEERRRSWWRRSY